MTGKRRVDVKLIVFGSLVLILLLTSLFAERLVAADPYAQNLSQSLKGPSADHIFGTDRYGRDLFARVAVGSTTSVFAALAVVGIVTVAGTAAGILCGWFGGAVDSVLMRVTDLFLAFPSLVACLAVAGVLGGGVANAMIALTVIGWPKFARLARGLTLTEKQAPYLEAAKLSGCTDAQLILRHVLPNIAGQILVTAALDIGTTMMELAGLSFLGLGVKPPMAEWGSMISEGRASLQSAPWVVIAPGGAILLTVTVFNLFGDALRDSFSPGLEN